MKSQLGHIKIDFSITEILKLPGLFFMAGFLEYSSLSSLEILLWPVAATDYKKLLFPSFGISDGRQGKLDSDSKILIEATS